MCLSLYASASKAKLNVDKCQTLLLGGRGARDLPVMVQILGETTLVLYLGVSFPVIAFLYLLYRMKASLIT